jgi:ribosomal protein L1
LAQDSDEETIEHIGSAAAINAEKESGETRQLEHIKAHIRKAQVAQAEAQLTQILQNCVPMPIFKLTTDKTDFGYRVENHRGGHFRHIHGIVSFVI